MIPLGRSDYIPTKPFRAGQIVCALLMLLWLIFEIRTQLAFDDRSGAMLEMFYHPGKSLLTLIAGLLVFPNIFSLVMNSIFAWVFFPLLFLRKRNLFLFPYSFVAIWIAGWIFFKIHPYLAIPIPVVDAWVGFFLGAVMRSDVWGNVDTIVIGPSIAKIFKVPSYVLLFFWFFYLMISNLFLAEPFSNLPMIYWMPFAAFIQGFMMETFLLLRK